MGRGGVGGRKTADSNRSGGREEAACKQCGSKGGHLKLENLLQKNKESRNQAGRGGVHETPGVL